MSIINSFTVITLTYNNYQRLNSALKSLSAQIFDKNLVAQLIILDDATKNLNPNDISALTEKYSLSKKYNIDIVINKENLGTVKSFNKAIEMSIGDIILPLSADDQFYDDFVISDIVSYFNKNESANITTCLRVPIVDNIQHPSLPKSNTWALFETPEKIYNYITFRGNIISGASTYYRKKYLNAHPFDEHYRYIEDFPYYLDKLSKGEKIYFLNRLSIKYSTKGVSSTINQKSIIYDDYMKIWNDILIKNSHRGLFYKRFIYFNHILCISDKRKLSKYFLYPEQYLFRIILNLIKKLR